MYILCVIRDLTSINGKMATEENPMKDCVMKFDHFENIHRLHSGVKFEGSPNFRQVPGYNVFGTGQPTERGFKRALDYMHTECSMLHFCQEVYWTNMRQEPVIYLNGQSYTPREESKLNENMEFPKASSKIIQWYQDMFVHTVRGRVGDDKKVFYYKDTYAEHPEDRKNNKMEAVLENKEDLCTLAEMYKHLNEKGYQYLRYNRAPIVDEKSPSEKDFESMAKSLVQEPYNSAFVFNCQMGKGRTTTGMVIGCLIKDAQTDPFKSFEQNRRPGRQDHNEMRKQGWYRCIQYMLNIFDGEKDKNHLDHILDLCGEPPKGEGLQNLRECIFQMKEKYENDSEEKKPFWLRCARNFIERYMYLICFTHYVRVQAFVGHHQGDLYKRFKNFPFRSWMDEVPGLREYIQDVMENFKWEV